MCVVIGWCGLNWIHLNVIAQMAYFKFQVINERLQWYCSIVLYCTVFQVVWYCIVLR